MRVACVCLIMILALYCQLQAEVSESKSKDKVSDQLLQMLLNHKGLMGVARSGDTLVLGDSLALGQGRWTERLYVLSRDTVWSSGGSLRIWMATLESDSTSRLKNILYSFKHRIAGGWFLEKAYLQIDLSPEYKIGDSVWVGSYSRREKRRIGSGFEDTEKELGFSPALLLRLPQHARQFVLQGAKLKAETGKLKFLPLRRLMSKLGSYSPHLIKLKALRGKWFVDGLFNVIFDSAEKLKVDADANSEETKKGD